MRVYLQLKTWQDVEQFYPILKYFPRGIKKFIAKNWLKPISIPWENGLDLYVLPVCRQSNFKYKLSDCLVLPQDEVNSRSCLITTLLIDILPQLAKLVGLQYEQDILLINELESIADVRFLTRLIKPWRYVIIEGSNKLKLKWLKDFCIRETGQVLLHEKDNRYISCRCSVKNIPKLKQALAPKLTILCDKNIELKINNLVSRFRVNIGKNIPNILYEEYGNYLPSILVKEWLIQLGIYHKSMSGWYDIIREQLGEVVVTKWIDDLVLLKIAKSK